MNCFKEVALQDFAYQNGITVKVNQTLSEKDQGKLIYETFLSLCPGLSDVFSVYSSEERDIGRKSFLKGVKDANEWISEKVIELVERRFN